MSMDQLFGDYESTPSIEDNEIIRPRHAADVFGQPDTRERMHAIPPPRNTSETIAADVEAVTRAEHQRRKERPLARGLLAYFPDALAEVANVSRVGNEQHNPGQPMHWAYGKSMDHADCVARHLIDAGTLDKDGLSHSAKVAWRALALLQTELEEGDPELHAQRQAQRERAAKGKP
jgi:hypothetical protein